MKTDVVRQIDSYPNTPDIKDIFEYHSREDKKISRELKGIEKELADNNRKGTFILKGPRKTYTLLEDTSTIYDLTKNIYEGMSLEDARKDLEKVDETIRLVDQNKKIEDSKKGEFLASANLFKKGLELVTESFERGYYWTREKEEEEKIK